MTKIFDTLLGAVTIATLSLTLALAVALGQADSPVFTPYSPPTVKGVSYISADEARFYMERSYIFLDAREKSAYEAGHVKGAILWDRSQIANAPQAQLKAATGLIAYCDGPRCGASSRLAKELLSLGYTRVFVMGEGYPDWESRGYPVEARAADNLKSQKHQT